MYIAISRSFMVGVPSQAEDAVSSSAPGKNSGFKGTIHGTYVIVVTKKCNAKVKMQMTF